MAKQIVFSIVIMLSLISTALAVGGTGSVRDATPDVQEICNGIRAEVEQKIGHPFEEFRAEQFRTQLVAGMNYFVKVRVDTNDYVHIRLYSDLSQHVFLHGVQVGKTLADPLIYFPQ
jgi:cystatin-A/B